MIDGNQLTLARDEYLASDEGRRMCNPVTLEAPERFQVYLQHRIECAFLAGAHAAEKLLTPAMPEK